MLIVFFEREDVDRRQFCRCIIGVSGVPRGPYCMCKTKMAASALRIKCCVLESCCSFDGSLPSRSTIGHYFPPRNLFFNGNYKTMGGRVGWKVVASHGTTHSKGVMVLFKPNLNVTINKTLADKNGRYILAETSNDETNIVFVNHMHQWSFSTNPFPKESVQLCVICICKWKPCIRWRF